VDFNGCAEVFEKIAVAGIKVVVGIIFKDLEPALAQFFTKDWYTQDTMETIIATLKDYYENEEVKTRILEASFRKLVCVVAIFLSLANHNSTPTPIHNTGTRMYREAGEKVCGRDGGQEAVFRGTDNREDAQGRTARPRILQDRHQPERVSLRHLACCLPSSV